MPHESYSKCSKLKFSLYGFVVSEIMRKGLINYVFIRKLNLRNELYNDVAIMNEIYTIMAIARLHSIKNVYTYTNTHKISTDKNILG